MSDQTPVITETLVPGLTLEKLHDDKIFVFTLTNVSRQSIDVWARAIMRHSLDLPTGQQSLLLNDFSTPEFTLTPYLRSRIMDIVEWEPSHYSSNAFVLPKTFTYQMMTYFIGGIRRTNMSNQLFYSRTDALAWLEKRLVKAS